MFAEVKSQFSVMARADTRGGDDGNEADMDDIEAAEERRLLQHPADILVGNS